ncbi:hypothetical protein PCANC_16117 [Puccinia coronata f. sp. avenae]|uniref:Uncharacterized protein n=1 Tax=Puccinia coronata f. sp. avenae TaxID=200324 RepID=A0A2N5SRV2_9BASI|nr:hypothetical protein PCANC_16117 [Puccinia coronata f. sp. avenae]
MDEPTEENRCEEATKEEEEDNTHAELPAEPASTIPESDLSIEKLISMVETASFLEETHPSDETPHTDGALEENRATQEELPHSEEELVIQDEPRIEPLSQAHLVVDQPMGQEATPILPQELPHSSHPSNPTTKSDQEDLTVEEQPLFNNTPLSDMSMSFDELESLIDHSEITQLKPTITDYQLEDPEELLALNDHQDIFALYEREEMLTSTRPPTELISIPTDVSPENESMDHPQPIKDGPDLPHNPQPNSTQPLRKTFGRPSATSSKILRTASIGQPSKTHPSSSGVSLLRPNPLSVRPEPKNPSKTPLPRSKIPSSIHPSNGLIDYNKEIPDSQNCFFCLFFYFLSSYIRSTIKHYQISPSIRYQTIRTHAKVEDHSIQIHHNYSLQANFLNHTIQIHLKVKVHSIQVAHHHTLQADFLNHAIQIDAKVKDHSIQVFLDHSRQADLHNHPIKIAPNQSSSTAIAFQRV